MPFEVFSGVGSKASSSISITGSKSFGFGAGFLKRYALLDHTFVTLMYDKDTRRIGFRFSKTKEGAEHSSYKLVFSKGPTKTASAVARSFFNTYQIDSALTQGRYEPVEDQQPELGKIFVINLDSKLPSNFRTKH